MRFNWYADRQAVWDKRRALKGTGVFVREDFPTDIQKARIGLSHTLTLAREVDKKATLKKDRLIFKGKAYTAESIPSELLMMGEAGPGAKVTDGNVCFSGRSSPFSNFHPSPFQADGLRFPTNEHYYQYHKARFAKEEAIAADILIENDPAKVKRLGDQVKAPAQWYNNVGLSTMTCGIVHKFQQNERLRPLITRCASKNFVECSQYDKFWANGLKFTDDNTGNPKCWKGRNMLGNCLNEAAKHFKQNYAGVVKHQ